MKRSKSLYTSMEKKHICVFIAIIVITVLFIVVGHSAFGNYDAEVYDDVEVVKAKVLSIDSIQEEEGFLSNSVKHIFFTAKIKSGSQKGEIVSMSQSTDSTFLVQDKEIDEGDSILVSHTSYIDTEEPQWIFIGYNRVDALILLCAVFFLLIILIGRKKGVSTIISLILTCLLIFLVYVPAILSGVNIYLSTTVIAIYIIFMSLILINGINKKTLCAVIGTVGGVFAAAIIAAMMNNVLKLSGLIDEQYVLLTYVNPENPVNLVAIIWGGMVLGSLGAIMDVAMSIASSVNELSVHMSRKSRKKMLRSGLNIGRDAIGTMTNTLILAYIGSSLALVLLLVVNNKNTLYLFSMEMIAIEIVQSVVGSMGILLAVPMTAAFAAYVYNRK